MAREFPDDFALALAVLDALEDAGAGELLAHGARTLRERPDAAEKPVCSGAESFIAGTASFRIRVDGVDELFAEMRASDVLHPVSKGGVDHTDFGTREFSALDLDGNLVTFFRWES